MEWIEGESLSLLMKLARAAGGVPLRVAARLAAGAAQGLHAAHELRKDTGELLGLVHRDVSPQNVLVTYDGVVKIVDFGIAKATQGDQGRTAAGVMKGKAQYMSPEQALGQDVDRRTDIFALGIVLYQLVSGKHPFRQKTDVATLAKICSADPVPPPSTHVPGCPPALDAIVLRALEKRPGRRFASMQEMAQALEATLPTLPGPTPELRDWVRATAVERAEKKRSMIREAQRLADARQGRAPSIALPNALLALSAGAGSSPDLVGPSSAPSLGLLSVTSASQPTQPAPSSSRSAPAVTRTGDVRIFEMEGDPPVRRSSGRWLFLALACAVTSAALVLVMPPSWLAGQPSTDVVAPRAPIAAPPPPPEPPAPTAATSSATPPDAAPTEAAPAESSPPTPTPSAKPAVPRRGRAGRPAPRKPDVHAAGDSTAPRILSPGF
jgi:serine/threonine-protein kinase